MLAWVEEVKNKPRGQITKYFVEEYRLTPALTAFPCRSVVAPYSILVEAAENGIHVDEQPKWNKNIKGRYRQTWLKAFMRKERIATQIHPNVAHKLIKLSIKIEPDKCKHSADNSEIALGGQNVLWKWMVLRMTSATAEQARVLSEAYNNQHAIKKLSLLGPG